MHFAGNFKLASSMLLSRVLGVLSYTRHKPSGIMAYKKNVSEMQMFPSLLPSIAHKMFITGGCRGNCLRAVRIHVAEPFHDATDEVWCFSPVTRTCTPAPAMPRPRTMHTAVVCMDRVYVIGGRTKGSTGASPSLLEVLLHTFLYECV